MSKKGGFCCARHIKAYLPQSYKLAVSLEREALEMCAASRLQWVWWSNCSPQWTAQHITECRGRALITPSHKAYVLADARSQDWARSGVMLFCIQTLTLFFFCPFSSSCFFFFFLLSSHTCLLTLINVIRMFVLSSLSPIRRSSVIYMTISTDLFRQCFCATVQQVL